MHHNDILNHHVLHACEEQAQDVILTHATILRHTFALPQFMDQHNYEYQEPSDTPITVSTAFQVYCDHSLHHECTHNPMAIKCNQYPNLSHNLALPQFLAQHNSEDLDPTDTPRAVPTALEAPSDDTYNPKCSHNPMETQCNQSQYPTLMKQNCTHSPSTSQVRKSNHSKPVAFPYPPDPGEHVLERSATPTALVERDKLDLSSLAPPKGRWKVLSVGPILPRVPHQALYVLVNLHLESSTKLNCQVIPCQALYVTSHLESSIKKLSFISPNILILFILDLHSLCQKLLLKQIEFPTANPA